jgi:hypothetical protein
MMIVLTVMTALIAWGAIATIRSVARDGYRRALTR